MYLQHIAARIEDLERELGVGRFGLPLGEEGHTLSQLEMVRAQQEVRAREESSASLAELEPAPDDLADAKSE